MADLRTNFLNMTLRNPFVVASGILGTSPSLMERCAREGAGAVTSKSAGPEPREGHANPVAVAWDGGVINAIGLTNPGCREEVVVLQATKARLEKWGVKLFASIFAPTMEDYTETAKITAESQPDLIEVNISCPNVASEFGTPFAASAGEAAGVTKAVKRGLKGSGIPISVKLAPNVPSLVEIARACVAEGADALTVINTMPAMLIDPWSGKPVLCSKSGGLSGPAIKPIALRCVYEVAAALGEGVPIIGTGGVSSGLDAAEMILAGATLVGVGSAVATRGAGVFGKLSSDLSGYMDEKSYMSTDQFRRKALS